MKTIRLFPAILLFLTLIAGCSGPSFSWVGQWKGRRDLKAKPGENEAVLNTLALVDLTLKPDGTFDLLDVGYPKSGDYRIDGQTAYLKVKTLFERPIETQGDAAVKLNEEIRLSAQKDGTVTFTDPTDPNGETIVLKRQKAESQPAP